MKVLLLNDQYFGDILKHLGHEVFRVGPNASNNLVVDPETIDFDVILSSMPFKPDVALQVDSIDTRVFFRGIENLPIPSAFIAIDSPINEFWQSSYCEAFDRFYVDQYDTWRKFQAEGKDWVRWLPLAADTVTYFPPKDDEERDLDVVFVGTIDGELRPKRSAILYRLKRVANVAIIDGGGTRSEGPQSVANLYRRAKIVLNEMLFDGVNLRTFEAMACGAVVLTERGRGTERVFHDGNELLTFNAEDLEQTVVNILNDEERLKKISADGINSIREKHTIAHRAAQVLRDLSSLKKRVCRFTQESKLEVAWSIWIAAEKWQYISKSFVSDSIKYISMYVDQLDTKRAAIFLEKQLNLATAEQHIRRSLNGHLNGNKSMRALLASVVLAQGKHKQTAEMVGVDENTSVADLHYHIGSLLQEDGKDLSPGYTSINAPVSLWNAFEHFQFALNLDAGNINAMKGLDKILTNRGVPEFTLKLWQNFHLNNPSNSIARNKLCQRAREGYFIPANVNTSAMQGDISKRRNDSSSDSMGIFA